MTLSEYLAGWHGTRATNRLLAVAVIAMATVAIVESAYLMERERIVVLVPPRLQEQATVGRSQADASYHTAWAHLLADMLGNVTPANAAFLKERLQPLLDPAIFSEVTTALERQLDEIRRERVTLAFEPKRIVFEPATGKTFALKQNVFRDDRRDVLASTRAALDYLQKLYGMFNDWQLALAAYNWGEGSVQKAIKRNEAAGLPTDYDSLRMPTETRNYVPKLQAIKNIVAHPEQFAVALPPLQNHPYFLSVPLDRDIDVDLAAKLAGVSMEEFRQLNPQVNKPVMLAAGTDQVLLPYEDRKSVV